MKSEERIALMESSTPRISRVHSLEANFSWLWDGCGFGGHWVFLHEDGRIELENECMSRESVRKILHALADHIADSYIPSSDFEIEEENGKA